MEETYERQLEDIVRRMPEGSCVVAMVPTVPLDQAAALASDVAQSIGSARAGHTILASFETSPARLDHEIGIEGGFGLTDVLARRGTMREVAAHGRARRFIYIPAGASAVPGESLLRSDAWRRLREAALRGGGTILGFIPPRTLDALMARGDGSGIVRFDAVVRLGATGGSEEASIQALIEGGAADLGGLELPGGPVRPDGARADERPAAPAPMMVGLQPRRRKKRKRRRRYVVTAAFIILLGALGALFMAVIRDGAGRAGEQVEPRFAQPADTTG